jgi:hypothetical protein
MFIPYILEPQGNERIFRRNWARLIQKIYETDPLVCPKCKGAMRRIALPECRSKWPTWRVNQQKDEPIDQKDSRRDTSLAQ